MKRGIGFYVRRLSERIHGTPEDFAANLAKRGVSFAAFMACWQDSGGTQDPNKIPLAKYARACADAGVEPWLWGFPRPQTNFQTEYFAAFKAHTQRCGNSIRGWIHDPEVYWQMKGAKAGIGMRGQGEAIAGVSDSGASLGYLATKAAEFIVQDLASRNALAVPDAGMTSYGAARWFGLPWDQLIQIGFGSPQIYSADSRERVQSYLLDWRAFAKDIRPSIPTFGVNAGSERAILDHAARFLNEDGTIPKDLSGFWVWSWEQTKGREWNAVEALAERFR